MPRLTLPRVAAISAVAVGLMAGLGFAFGGMFTVLAWGLGFAVGLAGVAAFVERAGQRIERRHAAAADTPAMYLVSVGGEAAAGRRGSWNPLDPAAPYYGRRSQRYRQSLFVLFGYMVLFGAMYFLAHLSFAGAVEPYELPAGGGSEAVQARTVQVKKVIKKKFVINPYSSVKFAPPPIENIDVKLTQDTDNQYQVGQGSGNTGDGDGDGAGFGKGTGKGKVRFLRLRHGDRGWDKNYGIGGDRNMLAEYAARTRQKVAEETEAIDAGQLAAFPDKKAPPLLYIAGRENLPLGANEKKILKQYLVERHGMILGDNVGGQGFHHSFVAAMNEITGTTPVPIPRDDRIHQRPFALPQLPIVVAHGGTTPLGWKLDGRWVVYYHPGALSDAWRDDHAGIKKDVYEMCYQLGVNVIFYAHREYNQWLGSQQP